MWTMIERYARLLDETGGTGGDGTGGGQGGGWNPPEGLPAEFRGANAEETLAKLFGGFSQLNTRAEGLRGELARRPGPLDSADKYTFDPGEKLKPFFGDVGQDPVFGFARQAAHKYGMSQDQFSGFIGDVFGGMQEKGLLAAPFDASGEVKSYMEVGGISDQKAAAAELTANEAFAKGLSGQLQGIPEKMKPAVDAALLSLTDTAAGNFLIKALSGRLAENGIRIPSDSQATNGMITKADLAKLSGDPRIDPVNREHPDKDKRFDPDLRAKYDEAYKRLNA